MASPGAARMTSSYMAGVRPPDPTVHAVEPGSKPDEYLALCDGDPVVPIPGRFDPEADNACQGCRRIVQDSAI